MGSAHPKPLPLHRKKLGRIRSQTLGNVKGRPLRLGAIFLKFRGEMAHIWQGALRSRAIWRLADRGAHTRLQPDPARLRRPRLCRLDRAVATAWSTATASRSAPISPTSMPRAPLTWQGRPAEAYDPALQHAAREGNFRRPRGAVLRLALSAVLPRWWRFWSPLFPTPGVLPSWQWRLSPPISR